MLYDKRWDKQTRADQLSLESLIAWLEQQPGDEIYEATKPDRCLLANWLRSMDSSAGVNPKSIYSYDYVFQGLPVNLKQFGSVVFSGGFGEPYYFGTALERARAIQFPSK